MKPFEAAHRARERAVQQQLHALEHRLTQQQQQHLKVRHSCLITGGLRLHINLLIAQLGVKVHIIPL